VVVVVYFQETSCFGFPVVSKQFRELQGLDMTPGGCAASYYTFNSTFRSLVTDVSFLFVSGEPAYFWSHQFGVAGGAGSNGYIGIQGDGSLFNGTSVGRACIFSLWNSLNAVALDENAVCGVFGGEGTGYSCRLEYPWVDGRSYR
jgi:hypothetical protein